MSGKYLSTHLNHIQLFIKGDQSCGLGHCMTVKMEVTVTASADTHKVVFLNYILKPHP